MIVTVPIDGRDVAFAIKASFPLRYYEQFGEDVFSSLLPLAGEIVSAVQSVDADPGQLTPAAIGEILQHVYTARAVDLQRMIYICARTADDDIPDIVTWYDSFEVFPFLDVLKAVGPAFLQSLVTKKNILRPTTPKTAVKK